MTLMDRTAGQLRVGDAEREAAVAALGEHYAAGRIAPLLLIVIALVVLTHLPWPILLVVGWLWWGRVFRRWSRSPGDAWRSYSMGSRRAVRGTWS